VAHGGTQSFCKITERRREHAGRETARSQAWARGREAARGSVTHVWDRAPHGGRLVGCTQGRAWLGRTWLAGTCDGPVYM
jgi:hypothetical protein